MASGTVDPLDLLAAEMALILQQNEAAFTADPAKTLSLAEQAVVELLATEGL